MEKWKFKLFSSSVERHDDTQAIVLAGFFLLFSHRKNVNIIFSCKRLEINIYRDDDGS